MKPSEVVFFSVWVFRETLNTIPTLSSTIPSYENFKNLQILRMCILGIFWRIDRFYQIRHGGL